MATDLIIELEDRPGELARVGETLGNAGVNIDGLTAVTAGGRGEVHLLVEDGAGAQRALEEAGIIVVGGREVQVIDLEDQPGTLGQTARRLADAGVNIELAYGTAGRLVLGVDDMEKAKGAV